MDKIKEHQSIVDELNKLYADKNQDYGNSFSEQFKEHGILSAVIRLDDKMRRLKQITGNDSKVKTETTEDTLMDLCNYSIMTLIELRNKTDDPYAGVNVVKVKKGVPSVVEIDNRRYIHDHENHLKGGKP